MRYLDPKNDLTFKKVFGGHPHLLKSFLNALLPLPEDEPIVSLEYLPPEMVPEIPILKNTIVDVRCVDAKGRQFIVEMQVLWTESFMARVLFNASKAYVKQLDKGQDFKYLQPVYSLNLVDDIYDESDEFYHHYQIVNIVNTQKKLKGLEFVFVELPKFKPSTISEKKLQVLWLRYLTEIAGKEGDVPQELLNEPEIREAIECLQESSFSKRELDAYDRYWDHVRVERALIDDSLEKGLKQGIEKGREEGMEEGERITLLKIALRNLRKGKSVSETADITELPVETIENINTLLHKYGEGAENHLHKLV